MNMKFVLLCTVKMHTNKVVLHLVNTNIFGKQNRQIRVTIYICDTMDIHIIFQHYHHKQTGSMVKS